MTTRILPPRAPDYLIQLATDFVVENAFAFLPHRRVIPVVAGAKSTNPTVLIGGLVFQVTDPLTLCNAYVHAFTTALGCPVPPMKANDQLAWLESNEGKMAGWFDVNRTMAVERAVLGYPAVAVAYKAPHGHIAMMMPSPVKEPGAAYCSAAGAANHHYVKLEATFGPILAPACRFFTHN